MHLRTVLFTVVFGALTAAATYAGAVGLGAETDLVQQQGLRLVGGRSHVGGGLRGGK